MNFLSRPLRPGSFLERIVSLIPFLIRVCPFGMTHWRWQQICHCGFKWVPEDGDSEHEWHGGAWDLRDKIELHPCQACFPEISEHSKIWHLSSEEEALVQAWRAYREETLDALGEEYKYRVFVETNDSVREFLLQRVSGAAVMKDVQPWYESSRGRGNGRTN